MSAAPGAPLRRHVAAWAALCLAAAGAALGADDTRLIEAVRDGQGQAVRALLQQGADVRAVDPDGTSALHWAARANDVESARLLIERGAPVDAVTRYGLAPLYFAAVHGNPLLLQALLDAGAHPDTATSGGETALMTAARTGRVDAVALLLDRGAALDARERARGQTALMWAVLEGDAPVVRLLLARGADIEAQSAISIPDGTSGEPEARSGNIGAHGPGMYRSRAVPSPSGAMTPLLYAARDGNLEMVRLLLDAGADIDRPAANGTTPLVGATINNHIDVALHLVERGADVNAADRFHLRTPLFAAVEMRNPDYTRDTAPPRPNGRNPMELIERLLAQGANPNLRTNTTPFRGFFQVSGNWANFDGQTPFLRAALNGDITLMRLLLAHGADPNIGTYDGATPLMAAAGVNWVVAQTFTRSDEEYLEAARLCLERGNDVNATNSQGFTAMHGAANRGFDAMIRLLAEHGATIDAPDKLGRTPLTFAEGVFLALNPPVHRPGTIALLQELMERRRQ